MSDEPQQRIYPEDERLRRLRESPDRRMTREEWEAEESRARQAAHQRHEREERTSPPDHGRHDNKRKQDQKDSPATPRQPLNRRKVFLWITVAAILLLVIFFAGWLPRHNESKKAKEEAKKRDQDAPEVDVVQVKRSRAPGELTVPGTTAPYSEAYVYARANGYLKTRLVDIGDHVRKGQLLAIIDAPDLDQQVAQAREQLNQAIAQLDQQKAQLELARVTWERWRVLVAKGVFSRQDGDQREADYKAQLANVSSAERNVESYRANLGRVIALQSYERVTAPFDGVITQRNVDVGALVGASGAASSPPMQSPQSAPTGGSGNVGSANTSGSTGSPNQSSSPSTGGAQGGALFGIAQNNKLRILVSVPEGYAGSVRRGMKAHVYIQERVGKPIEGEVTRTSDSIDQNSRTMLAEVDLDNRDGSLYPGIYSIVSFVQVRGVSPLTVPGDAIVVRQDRTTVATVQNDMIHMVPVEIGRDYGPSVEILSGLREGDWVVTTVTDRVQPDVKVRAQQDKEAGEENSSQGKGQTNGVPDAGPGQYGDQSIVNSKSESTNQKGKPGQSKGGQQGQSQKPGGKQPKQDKKGSQ